jgi:hypothetical protein
MGLSAVFQPVVMSSGWIYYQNRLEISRSPNSFKANLPIRGYSVCLAIHPSIDLPPPKKQPYFPRGKITTLPFPLGKRRAGRGWVGVFLLPYPFTKGSEQGRARKKSTARIPAAAGPAGDAAAAAKRALRSGGCVRASARTSDRLPRACTAARRTTRTASAGHAPRAG